MLGPLKPELFLAFHCISDGELSWKKCLTGEALGALLGGGMSGIFLPAFALDFLKTKATYVEGK